MSDLKLAGDIDYSNPDKQEAIKKANIKYVRKFLEAQLAMQELNRPGVESRVFINRVKPGAADTDDAEDLTYETPEEFDKALEKGNDKVLKKFTINDYGEVVIAEVMEVITDGVSSKTYRKVQYNYKSLISQYSTPAQFFIYLGEIVANPEFLAEITDKLIKQDSKIQLTVLDNKTTVDVDTLDKWTAHTWHEPTTTTTTVNGVTSTSTTPGYYTTSSGESETDVVTITPSTSLVVTYVNTWQLQQTMKYEKETTGPDVNVETEDRTDGTPGSGSYTEHHITITTTTTTENFILPVASDYIYRAGEKPDEDPTYTSFVDLLDKKFKLPNSTRKVAAGPNLRSAPEWFFTLLGQDEGTRNMETFMRYVMYKYTGKSYGVKDWKELDFSAFEPGVLTNTSNVSDLEHYLQLFSHGSNRTAPQSADGKYYLVYGDGVGWPTIGDSDLQWRSNYSKFNVPGKVLKNGVEITVDNVADYVNSFLTRGPKGKYTNAEIEAMQIYVEKELVDQVGRQTVQVHYDAVETAVAGITLSEQQKYALTEINYNFGHLPTRNGRTFKQVYQDGAALYGVNSWQHNRYIWDNWWALLGGGSPGHIKSRDMTFETYVKGNLEPAERTSYMFYTQAQLNSYSYAPKLPITRTASNEQQIFTYEEAQIGSGDVSGGIAGGGLPGTNGSVTIQGTKVATYTNSWGLTFIEYKQIEGPWAGMRYGSKTIKAQGCNITSLAIALSGYGYNFTPAKWSGSSLVNAPETTGNYLVGTGTRTYPIGKDKAYRNVQASDKQTIQNYLRQKNTVMIYVLGQKKGYSSSFTKNQHWMMLLDINNTGDKVYVSNPSSSSKNGWVDIDDVLQSLCSYTKIGNKRK